MPENRKSVQPESAVMVLMPWLRLRQPYVFGAFKFEPVFERSHFSDRWERYTFRKLAHIHRENTGSPCRQMTVIINQRTGKLTWDETEIRGLLRDLEIAVACLCVTALSERELFFPLGYCNAASFEWFPYRHPVPRNAIVVWNRQRSGERWGFMDVKSGFRRVAPVQCTHEPVTIDASLLHSLEQLTTTTSVSGSESETIVRAVEEFCRGNRDDTFVGIRWDTGMMASAIEQLTGANKKSRDKGKTIGQALQDYFTSISAPMGLSHESTDEWAREFYNCRHEPIHGHRLPQTKWERYVCHPTMAAFVFPLALKCKLAQKKLYTLSDRDKGWIDAIPRLLEIKLPDHWRDEVDGMTTRWRAIINKSANDRVVRSAIGERLGRDA